MRILQPQGDLQVMPNRRVVRLIRFGAIAGMVLLVAFGAFLPVLGVISGQPRLLLLGLFLLALLLGCAWLVWRLTGPPALNADAMQVTYDAPLNHQGMARSDLALILRGLTVHRGRYTTWLRSYLFVARDGKVRIVVPAFWFPNEGITALAQHLNVPVKGDFSQQVRGRVDLTPN